MHYGKRFFRMCGGLSLCGAGAYLIIQANIGLAPWDALNMGLSYLLGTSYGNAGALCGATVLLIDLLLREKIGLGTLVDGLLLGKFIDLLLWWNPVPMLDNFWQGLLLLIPAQAIICLGCYFYISAGLCCGPRDALMVGLGKRLRKFPIGLVRILLEGAAVLVGWLLGAKVGLGSLISVVLMGAMLEAVFRLFHFRARAVQHEGVLTVFRNIKEKQRKNKARPAAQKERQYADL